MPTLLYNSKNVILTYGGKLIVNVADGDFLKVAFSSDYIMRTMGTDGLGTLSVSRDESADIELSLMASSPSNDYLSAIFQAQRNGVIGLPFLAKDTGGTSIHEANSVYIVKVPDRTYSRQVSTVVWQLGCTAMNSFQGSNTFAN